MSFLNYLISIDQSGRGIGQVRKDGGTLSLIHAEDGDNSFSRRPSV